MAFCWDSIAAGDQDKKLYVFRDFKKQNADEHSDKNEPYTQDELFKLFNQSEQYSKGDVEKFN
jgi:hypothetical protein